MFSYRKTTVAELAVAVILKYTRTLKCSIQVVSRVVYSLVEGGA